MKINVKTGDELNRLLDNLQQEIVYANIYYRLYWDLNDALRSHPEEFAQSNTFWVLTFDALQDAWLIRLCRVFDTQCNNNLNLVNLLETIKENLHFFNEQNFRERLKDNAFVNSLAECDRVPDQAQLDKDIEFAKADPLVEKLRIWRNNIVAHKGSKFVLGKAPQLSEDPLTHSEVETLLNQGFEIFNRYSQLYRASSWSRQIIGHDDYRFLLRLIKLGLKYYDENIHTEFAAFPNEEDGLY